MTLKPANAYKRERFCPMTSARARAWRNVGLFCQRNKHYSLHKKICTRCAYEACQGVVGNDTRPSTGVEQQELHKHYFKIPYNYIQIDFYLFMPLKTH